MDASKAFRPIGVVAATALLLTGVACGGARDRVASRRTSTSAPATTVVAASATTAPAAAAGRPSGSSVRTDDLEADLKQADSQLTQTSTAVSDADQNTQQLND